MRMWHVFVICLAYGIWSNYDYVGPHVVQPLMRATGITIPGLSNRPAHSSGQSGSLRQSFNSLLSNSPGAVMAQPIAVEETMIESSHIPMPSFTLYSTDGMSSFSSSQLRGQPTVLVFFAGWCGHCRADMPQLVALKRSFPAVRFIGVVYKDTALLAKKCYASAVTRSI